jgi:hypothetical protein
MISGFRVSCWKKLLLGCGFVEWEGLFWRASGRQLVTSSGARKLLPYWGDTHKPIRGTVAGK